VPIFVLHLRELAPGMGINWRFRSCSSFLAYIVSLARQFPNHTEWYRSHSRICHWSHRRSWPHRVQSGTYLLLTWQWWAQDFESFRCWLSPMRTWMDYLGHSGIVRSKMNISCLSFEYLRKRKRIYDWNGNSSDNAFLRWYVATLTIHQFAHRRLQLFKQLSLLPF